MSVIILPSKSSTWRLSAFLMSHIFKDHFYPPGYFWFQPATRVDAWPYNYYKTAGHRFTATSLIISYLHRAPGRWNRLWTNARKLNSLPCFTLWLWGNYQINFLFLFQTTLVFFRNGNCLSSVKIYRLCFISMGLTCHLKEEIILFVPLLSVSAAKACCKSRSASTCRRADILAPSTWLICGREYCFLHGGVAAVRANGAHVLVSSDGFYHSWRWLACRLWDCGASIRRRSLILLVMGCEAPLFPLSLSFDCFFLVCISAIQFHTSCVWLHKRWTMRFQQRSSLQTQHSHN